MRVNGAPRPAFDNGDWIERLGVGSAPLRTSADHEDDEVIHGGLTSRDADPLATLLWLVMMLLVGGMVVLAGVAGAYW